MLETVSSALPATEGTYLLVEKNGKDGTGRTIAFIKKQKQNHRHHDDDSMYSSPLDTSLWVFFGGLFVITIASLITRLYKLSEPQHIA